VAPRVPRGAGVPLTKNQYAHPQGLGPQFGTGRSQTPGAAAVPFEIRTAEGAKTRRLSAQGAVPGHWYELRLVIQPAASAKPADATGTLYYRDLTADQSTFSQTDLTDVPLGLTDANRPSLWRGWVVQGKFSGQYDQLRAGILTAPPSISAPTT